MPVYPGARRLVGDAFIGADRRWKVSPQESSALYSQVDVALHGVPICSTLWLYDTDTAAAVIGARE